MLSPGQIAEKILALRRLTLATGTKTTRSQNDILRSLDDQTLIAVAVILQRYEQQFQPLSKVVSK